MTARPPDPSDAGVDASAGFGDDPLWYKDAVIYQVHVKSFYDANGDGIGDFAGLIDKLDYIAGLGVNAIWLLPFYPSPRRDDGYDIADYLGVHPDYGTLADARRFVHEAHRRGLRVITELVINHTSDQHPWFQRARRARPGSAWRNFYVWSDDEQRYAGTRIIFLDTEKSNWTWDPVAGAYYWHRFYAHQPDLNFDNPQVLKAVLGVMRRWLELGVDGLRLDAVPYLIEREGTSNENLPETHAILRRIRAELDARFPGRMLLAEANQWPEDTQHYFGGKPADKSAGGGGDPTGDGKAEIVGDECHMAFHFPLMPRMYMALAQEDRFPITDILRQTPEIPANCQWAIFLRNHDELTLEMVTDKERDYLWSVYASDKRARLNLGIRRRLAPLLERDRRRIELLNSLLLSMPGTPVIYYGDEIGMGDNIHLGDRDGVRTPMQWSPDRNGGFSEADPEQLVLPPNMGTLYGFDAVNVEAQQRDPHSLLNWMRRLLAIRKRTHVFGRGSIKLLYPRNRRILAYLREYTGPDGLTQTVLCVANVSRTAQAVELELPALAGRVPVEMIGGSAFPQIGQLPYLLTLPPLGFYWFWLAPATQLPVWYAPQPEPLPDLQTLVLRRDLAELLDAPLRTMIERDILPSYLAKRRWFPARDGAPLPHARFAHVALLRTFARPLLFACVEVDGGERYQLPLGLLPEEEQISALPFQLALARVRRGPRVAYLTDAYSLDAYARGLVAHLGDAPLPLPDGRLRFAASPDGAALQLPADAEVRRIAAERANSSLIVGEKVIVKIVRHLLDGPHPEAEMDRHLAAAGYPNIAPLLGEIVYEPTHGAPMTLALVHAFVHNQGDAWTWVQNLLARAMHDATQGGQPSGSGFERRGDALAEIVERLAQLGERLAAMHALLAQPGDDPAFAPATADAAACARWSAQVHAHLASAFAALEARAEAAEPDAAALARPLLAQRAAIEARVAALAARGVGAPMTRTHGDLHLGEILIVQDQLYFIDFEGAAAQPAAERRARTSPLRDVASLLGSLERAADAALGADDAALGDGEGAQRREVAEHFRTQAATSFLAAYAAASPAAAPPRRDALLELFGIETAALQLLRVAHGTPAEWATALQHFHRRTLGTVKESTP
ncbi:maltose alpha-D-glucosyltransferase [Solimonas variicoloris]|uniref:maltose alpha-D-glucosyltransferase n=1 Tax=Solimonas variicoloris TaxID=254408 RepID=UPI00036AB424|nr:maltose alpha-D-glucosyltransferase [Solimonas variicoloris]